MKIQSTLTTKIFFSLLIGAGLFACAERQKQHSGTKQKVEEPVSFREYFEIDQQHWLSSLTVKRFTALNSVVHLDNQLTDSLKMEIRLTSERMFWNTYYYRMCLKNDGTWVGTKYTLEGVTDQLLGESVFVPKSGWKTFEKTIAGNNILQTGIGHVKSEMGKNTVHPRVYTFQILLPKSTTILNYDAFYENANHAKSKDEEFFKMTRIMNSIF